MMRTISRLHPRALYAMAVIPRLLFTLILGFTTTAQTTHK
jgi:hypothetical protein